MIRHCQAAVAAGFTLIELLIAVAITSVVMILVGTTFTVTLESRAVVDELAESTAAGPRILSLIERDLRGLWTYNIRDNKVFLGRNSDVGSRVRLHSWASNAVIRDAPQPPWLSSSSRIGTKPILHRGNKMVPSSTDSAHQPAHSRCTTSHCPGWLSRAARACASESSEKVRVSSSTIALAGSASSP